MVVKGGGLMGNLFRWSVLLVDVGLLVLFLTERGMPQYNVDWIVFSLFTANILALANAGGFGGRGETIEREGGEVEGWRRRRKPRWLPTASTIAAPRAK